MENENVMPPVGEGGTLEEKCGRCDQISDMAVSLIGQGCDRHMEAVRTMSLAEFRADAPTSCQWCDRDEMARLRAEAKRYREALLRLAYPAGVPFSEPHRCHVCPVCSGTEMWPFNDGEHAHTADCWLGIALTSEGADHAD